MRNGMELTGVVTKRGFLVSGGALIARRAMVHCLCLTGLFLFLTLPSAARAQDFTYTSDGSEITIIGYTGSGGEVIIPDTIENLPVAGIGDNAFQYSTNLTSVIIPSSVTTIGSYAFSGCTGLTSVTIGNGVTTIGDYAFNGSTSLTTITVDSTNPSYSSVDGVLFNKDKTTLIRYPEGKVGSYSVPDSVTNIGDWAFRDCTRLESVTIPDSVTTISGGGFYRCRSLTSITIPNSVTFIGHRAFGYCTSVANVVIPDGVSSIGEQAFVGCTDLNSVTIPDSVTTIGRSAFSRCTALKSVMIPDSVTSIGEWAFADCNSLMSVTIGNGVTSIEDHAFYLCTSLTSVMIPDSVTSIEGYAFLQCTSLTTIAVGSNNLSYNSLDGVLFNRDRTVLLQCPGGKSGSYTIPDSVTFIAEGAFAYSTSLTSVTIGSGITTVGILAFANCTSLTSVTIPASVTSIEGAPFAGCTSLMGVYFEGDAPSAAGLLFGFVESELMTVYFLAGTTGWEAEFGGQPTALWVVTEQPALGAVAITANQFGFTITGAIDQVVVVEICTDLSANPRVWVEADTLTLTGGSDRFTESEPATQSVRVYRIKAQ